jgi:chondroitin AC lyase
MARGQNILLLALACVLFEAGATHGQSGDASADLDRLRDNFIRSLLPTRQAEIAQINREADRDAGQLRPDRTWADIDYQDKTRSDWKTSEHLSHTLTMAQSARLRRVSGQADPLLEAKTIAALQLWLDRDFQNSNWWWNQIGVPRRVGRIGLLLGAQLPEPQRQKIITIMRRSQWEKWTGANLVWGMGIQALRGLLENDPRTIFAAFDRMYQEIRVVPQHEEGIQNDDSFHQHGVQLYNGGYGLDFAEDAGDLIACAAGTQFQIPPDRRTIFTSFLLGGERWMMRGGVFDHSAVGREITRKRKPGAADESLAAVVARLAEQPWPRQSELRDFAQELAGSADAPQLVGNKQFWCSDFMAHRRPEYFTSVKMLSTRMQNGEIVNGEGKLSQHLSDGANFLYLSGHEYENIFPAWNWSHVPGTTAIADVLDSGNSKSVAVRGGSDFAGGASDGTFGLCAMELARPPLTAHKAWFFYDHAYLCLGAGITLAEGNGDVITDVNQTLLDGDVVTDSQKFSQTSGVMGNAMAWVYHNHVGYILGPGTPARLWAGPRTGRWSDSGTGSSTPVTLGVFDLWIDHGRGCRDGKYQYIVLPATTAEQTASRATDSGINVLANTTDIQAAYNGPHGMLGIVFWKPGSLETPIGRIESDLACLVMVRDTADGRTLTVANPRNAAARVNIALGGRKMSIDLPGGDDGGRSVTTAIK